MVNQTRTAGWLLALGWALSFSSWALAADAPRKTPPNLVVVLLDNVGQDWFGCYGSLEGTTPEIDRLASAGLRFPNCYTTPYCSVSRVELLTGQYPFRTGWHIHHDAGIYGGGNFDALHQPTFAQSLRDAGYATAIAGKWQISNFQEPSQVDALARAGFDEHCVWPDGPVGHEANAKRYWDAYIVQQGKRLDTAGRFGPDVLHEFAVDFVRRHRDRPFLLYYPSVLTHGPHVPVPPQRENVSQLDRRALFAEMIRYADRDVARLVRALTDAGVLDNTIVLVTSDNGNTTREAGRMDPQGPAGGGYTLVEGGINMPLVVYSPRLVPGGRVSRRLVDFTDIFPTLLGLAGATLPSGVTLDGRSFADEIRGDTSQGPGRGWIFSEYAGRRVIRDQRYKLYSTGEFYDITADPRERSNLAASATPEQAEARRKLQAALASLPADGSLPFVPRSQSAYKLRGEMPPKKDSPPKK